VVVAENAKAHFQKQESKLLIVSLGYLSHHESRWKDQYQEGYAREHADNEDRAADDHERHNWNSKHHRRSCAAFKEWVARVLHLHAETSY